MIVGLIENGLERSFVTHRLNHLLITDPLSLLQPSFSQSLCICKVMEEGDGIPPKASEGYFVPLKVIFSQSVAQAKKKSEFS